MIKRFFQLFTTVATLTLFASPLQAEPLKDFLQKAYPDSEVLLCRFDSNAEEAAYEAAFEGCQDDADGCSEICEESAALAVGEYRKDKSYEIFCVCDP